MEQAGLTVGESVSIIRSLLVGSQSEQGERFVTADVSQRTAREFATAVIMKNRFSPEDPKASARRTRLIGLLGGIPTTLAAAILIGFFFGRWVDDKFETTPWFQLAGVTLGLIAAIRSTRRLLKRAEKEMDEL